MLFLAVFLTFISPVSAQDKPSFGLPIDCNINENCWIMNYVDMDLAENAFKDPFCGPRGYDGHKGTDFAIQSKIEMDEGVRVLAAKAGTVEKIRDGAPDRFANAEDIEAVKEARKECGNAVLIDHGNTLKTIYCHLKKDSVAVETGQTVEAGDVIGEVGLSGMTEFPHLHFGILWEGAVIDPFTGQSNTQGCGTITQPLWDTALNLNYTATSLYHAGFSNRIPDIENIDRGQTNQTELTADQSLLTFWFAAFGAQEGDSITMTITAPDGSVFVERDITQPKTRARQFYFVGKRTEDEPLMSGIYTGTVEYRREKQNERVKLYKIERQLTVTD
ncbi:MAG: M23 family metallopeptidase [Pseudomonadota bacterium]